MPSKNLQKKFVKKIKGIIFDCDGVLFDSRASNVEFFNKVLKELKLPPLRKEDESFVHMASTGESFAKFIPAHLHPLVHEATRKVDYSNNILPLLTPNEGLYDFLELLGAYGLKMAVATNRSNSVNLLLEKFQLSRYFFPVITVDRAEPKPSPEPLFHVLAAWSAKPDEAAFIGDTEADYGAALGAGVPFWAFDNPKLLAQLHISSFRELHMAFKEHIS